MQQMLSSTGLALCTVLTIRLVEGATPRRLIASVQHVSDGNTLTTRSGNVTKHRIRLLGIDAPEVPHGDKAEQPFGEEARHYLDHLIGGKTVRVDAYGPDKYKRVLAVVGDEQIIINLLKVAMGYAEVYRGAACQVYCQELEEAEEKARSDRVGMWAQAEKYESPAAYRQRLRLRGEAHAIMSMVGTHEPTMPLINDQPRRVCQRTWSCRLRLKFPPVEIRLHFYAPQGVNVEPRAVEGIRNMHGGVKSWQLEKGELQLDGNQEWTLTLPWRVIISRTFRLPECEDVWLVERKG